MASEHSHNERTFVEFVTESRETLQQAEELLSSLGRLGGQRALAEQWTDADRETIQALFRCFHSLKGAASFLKLQHTAGLAHAAQSLLDMYRRNAPIERAHVKLLRQSVSTLRGMLDNIENDYNDEQTAVESHEVTVALGAVVGTLRASGTAARAPNGAVAPAKVNTDSATRFIAKSPKGEGGQGFADARVRTGREDPLAGSSYQAAEAPGKADQISVRVAELDALSRLVDDLILAVADAGEQGVSVDTGRDTNAQMQRLTHTLRETIAAMRLVPLRETFTDVAMRARGLAAKQERWLEVETRGEDTGVDRGLSAELRDVLATIVLGAVERAHEGSGERTRTGAEAQDDGPAYAIARRNVVGKLVLSARPQGDEVWITVRDGGGADPWLGNGTPGLDVLQRRVASFGGRLEWTTDSGHATSCTVRIPRV